jgi:CheY-like chemotaxis protein
MLIAEDNPSDLELTRAALVRARVDTPVHFVSNGAQVLSYLKGEAQFGDRSAFPMPRLLVLDIQMPYLTGLEVLEWLRAHEEYSLLPTTMLTSSRIESDIERAYALGANAYITKPGRFEELITVLQQLYGFWRICEVPRIPRTLSEI